MQSIENFLTDNQVDTKNKKKILHYFIVSN